MKMKYTLIAEDEYGGSTTTREFTEDYLPHVLTEIELFLKGAGFVFNGNLDFVDEFAETNMDFGLEQDFNEEEFQEMEYEPPHVGEMHDTMGNLPKNNWPFAVPSPKTFGPHDGAPDEWTQILRKDAAAEGHSPHYFDTERNK
jgi:hypothetical protein